MSDERQAAAEAGGAPAGSGAGGADRAGATRSAEGSVEIDAPPERVWRALTEAAELERWFPLEARVEPGEGGSIFMSWKNEYAGESEILVWDPPRHLRTSWGAPDEGGPAQVTDYYIEGRKGGGTILRVVTSGFPTDSSWDDWVEGTRKGWRFELESLRRYLEDHDGEDREVVYLRRRVPLTREEAWGRLFGPGGLGGRPLGGEPFDDSPPAQYAAVVDDPPGAVLRVSTEPCGPGVEAKDVTLWLQAWGGREAGGLVELQERWREMLGRLFPEGETL